MEWRAGRLGERDARNSRRISNAFHVIPAFRGAFRGLNLRGAHRYVYGTSGNGQVSIKTREGSKVIKLWRESLAPFACVLALSSSPSLPSPENGWLCSPMDTRSNRLVLFVSFSRYVSPMRSRTVLSILAVFLSPSASSFFSASSFSPLRFRTSFHGSPLDNPAIFPLSGSRSHPIGRTGTHNAYVFIRAIPYSPVTVTRRHRCQLIGFLANAVG